MLFIPNAVFDEFLEFLGKKDFSAESMTEYKKWLRYYLDFCSKYPMPDSTSERVRLFTEKLKEKKQNEKQRERAAHAVSLYLEMIMMEETSSLPAPTEESALTQVQEELPVYRRTSNYIEAGYAVKTDSAEWDAALSALAGEIKVRHYSRKTLKTYANWSRKFQRFLANKSPQELTTEDVKKYLTYLAVACKVAASTQNQAFNSLLFLFRHALKREFGELRDVPRAKQSLYIPMVLSRPEIDAIIQQLSYPYTLVIKVLFGCGLRLFECLQLRVGDFNFDTGLLLAHGKGKMIAPCRSRIRSERN